jgi:hypothetical protein
MYAMRPSNPGEKAEDVFAIVVSGDSGKIAGLISEEELKFHRINRLVAQEAIETLVLPRFGNLEPMGPAKLTYSEPVGEAVVASQRVKSDIGREFALATQIFKVEDSSYHLNLTALIVQAWYARFELTSRRKLSGNDPKRAVIEGIDEDLETLHKLGIKCRVYDATYRKPITWEDLRSRFAADISKTKQLTN